MNVHDHPSIVASERYLRRQSWWPAYERIRPAHRRLSDVLFLGHFCSWLTRRGVSPGECSRADVSAYAATLQAFRVSVRPAYVHAAEDLVDFLAVKRRESPRRHSAAAAR